MFQLKYEGRKRPMSHLEGSQGEGTVLLSLFGLFRCLIDWRRPTDIREGNVL